jgi:hypothetical protein
MNLEAPADAWYVWVGVALVSMTVAGVVAGLPSQPPPDAQNAANTVDRVAASEYGTTAEYEPDADAARVGTRQIGLRNDGGTQYASVTFAAMTPVAAARGETHEAATALLSGARPETVVDRTAIVNERVLWLRLANVRERIDSEGATWRPVDTIRVRSVRIDGKVVVLVGV